MKRIYYNLMLIILMFNGVALAGSIKGKVTNGTVGFKVPNNITVELSRYFQNQQDTKFKLKTTTNKSGYFSFKNVTPDSSAYYQPTVLYKAVSYTGKAAVITTEKQTAESDVKVYEPTKSDSLLLVSMHHFLISPAEGFLSIKEVLLIENSGDRTYVGAIPTKSGKFITINYKLPKDATNISLGSGLMSCCVESDAGGFYDTMEIQPGGKQIAFSYRIKAIQKQISFTKQVTLPTKEFDVLLYGSNAVLTGIGLREMKTQKFQNTDIKRFTAYNLKAGQRVVLNLAGLTGTPTNWSIFILAGIVVILLLTGIFIYFKQKKDKTIGLQTDSVEIIDENEKEIIIRKIIALDEKFEAGNMEEKEYSSKREKLKNKLKT